MKWVKDTIEDHRTAAGNARYKREQEEVFFADMGKQIAGFANELSTLYIKETFQNPTQEQQVAIAELQDSLRHLANQSLMKFLSESKVGREIALKSHIHAHAVNNAELVALTHVIRERLEAVGDARFATDINKRDAINRFDNDVQGRIQIISHEMQQRVEPAASTLGM